MDLEARPQPMPYTLDLSEGPKGRDTPRTTFLNAQELREGQPLAGVSPTGVSEGVESNVGPWAGWTRAQHLCRTSKAGPRLPVPPPGPHCAPWAPASLLSLPGLGPQCLSPRSPLPRPACGSWEPPSTLHSWPPIQAFLLFICTARRQKAIPVSHPLCSSQALIHAGGPWQGLTRPLVSWFLNVLTAKGICGFRVRIKAQGASRCGWPQRRPGTT